ncbi:MAG: sulfatase-like hydrolase/transferase [Acidobacteriota bacterium]|nr:sulfatase-like hydrolase/transferase [Acidobacteriota bacterium]
MSHSLGPILSRRSLFAGTLAATRTQRLLAQQPKQPNVIVILFDDLGVSDLGFLGASDLRTPYIDRLARGGTVFSNWYSNAPVCAPARSALMTGRSLGGRPTTGDS